MAEATQQCGTRLASSQADAPPCSPAGQLLAALGAFTGHIHPSAGTQLRLLGPDPHSPRPG